MAALRYDFGSQGGYCYIQIKKEGFIWKKNLS